MRSTLLLAASLLLLACSKPAIRVVTELPEASRRVISQPFPRYLTSDAIPPGAFQPGDDALVRHYLQLIPPDVRTRVQHHPALDWAATVCAHTVASEEKALAGSLMQWMTWKVGTTAVNPFCDWRYAGSKHMGGRYKTSSQVLHQEGVAYAGPVLAEHLTASARSLKPQDGRIIFGIARLQVGPSMFTQAIVWGRELVSLAPLPKRIPAGEDLRLEGRFVGPVERPTLYIDHSEDGVRRIKLKPAADGSFSVTVPIPDEPGRYFLQIQGVRPSWKNTFQDHLRIPLYVGMDEPREPGYQVDQVLLERSASSAWAQRILAAYNAERSRRNLPPLSLHPLASRKADAHAARNAQAHTNDLQEKLQDVLVDAGVDAADVSQRTASTADGEQYLWDALISPGHRAAILDPAATHLALGIQPDRTFMRFVEYVITPTPQIDPAVERTAILDELARRRAKTKKPPQQVEPLLQAAVDAFTARVCAGELEWEQIDQELAKTLRAHRLAYRDVAEHHFTSVKVDPRRWARKRKRVWNGKSEQLAVGVCQGPVEKGDKHKREFVLVVHGSGFVQADIPVLDVAQAREMLRARVAAVRGAPLLAGDPALEAVLQARAEASCAEGRAPDGAEGLIKLITPYAPQLGNLAAAADVGDLPTLTTGEPFSSMFKDPRYTRVSIGICQAAFPLRPRGAAVIVVLSER